jgi:hypothetical protein
MVVVIGNFVFRSLQLVQRVDGGANMFNWKVAEESYHHPMPHSGTQWMWMSFDNLMFRCVLLAVEAIVNVSFSFLAALW